MVRYSLLQRPAMSAWSFVPRQIRTIFVFAVVVFVVFLITAQSSRNAKFAELHILQGTVVDIFDLEIKYISASRSGNRDTWFPTGVPEGHVYSAYVDIRPEVILGYRHQNSKWEQTWAEIRIIAILPLDRADLPLTCHYKYRTRGSETEIRSRLAAKIKAIGEHWDLEYAAFFVLCDLTLSMDLNYETLYHRSHLPVSVSLGEANKDYGKPDLVPFVDINYPKRRISRISDFDKFLAVCMPVLHNTYDEPLRLIEFFEYYSMMGAEQFMVYNSSVSERVNRVLEVYASRGTATVMQWQLPDIYEYEKTLRGEGDYAALNDCFYRSSFHEGYEYVAHVGVGDFIVPRVHKNLKEMMFYLDPHRSKGLRNQYAAFVFRNVFYTMYDDVSPRDPKSPYLVSQAKTTRRRKFDEAGIGSRYIVRSKDAIELGKYSVQEFRRGVSMFSRSYDELVVDPDLALTHRYSGCEAEETGCYLKPTTIDETAPKFSKKLEQRVTETCGIVFGTSSCTP
ncbi:uncharacterized protein LOC105697652 [Orussus abietinus]|uniref:uncharacterized protein LOC105697652 n=1 Tax=Orussus abietinus TaxID=222816 RepID=UPI000626828A|nr:uncharacterized protein LOC105697652 [Orussus abietinus]